MQPVAAVEIETVVRKAGIEVFVSRIVLLSENAEDALRARNTMLAECAVTVRHGRMFSSAEIAVIVLRAKAPPDAVSLTTAANTAHRRAPFIVRVVIRHLSVGQLCSSKHPGLRMGSNALHICAGWRAAQ